MDIGNDAEIVEQDGKISLPFDNLVSSIHELVVKVFLNQNAQYREQFWQQKMVNGINNHLLEQQCGDPWRYKSIETVLHTNDTDHYAAEFLNSLAPLGLPPHELHLKAGVPITLLRRPPPKLCNGMRFIIKKLMQTMLEATIPTRNARAEDVFILKTPLFPSDKQIYFKRLQLPTEMKLCDVHQQSKSLDIKVERSMLDALELEIWKVY